MNVNCSNKCKTILTLRGSRHTRVCEVAGARLRCVRMTRSNGFMATDVRAVGLFSLRRDVF